MDAKVHEEIDKGVLFAMTSELEVEVVEKIVAMCPAVEMVRLACSAPKRPCMPSAWRAPTPAAR